jgi:hypothetical protein
MFLILAIAIGAGVAIGGLWVHDTYFPSAARCLEKARSRFDKAEQVYAHDPTAAEPLYLDVDEQLDQMAERATKDDTATNVQGFLLRAKVLLRRARIAGAREKAEGKAHDADSESVKHDTVALGIYHEMLEKYDRSNVDAASYLLDYYMAIDDVGRAEQYAPILAAYQPAEGEKITPELVTRQAASHYLLADKYLRGPNPQPALALRAMEAIEKLPPPDGSTNLKKEKRWREYAIEARAWKVRLDMARKQAAQGAPPAKGAVADDPAAQLRAKIAEGIARAQADVKAPLVPADDKNPAMPALARLNPTNVRGILDFLTLAIENSTSKEEIIERADLLLTVCEQLIAGKKTRQTTFTAVANHLAKLPTLVDQPAKERNDPNLGLSTDEWRGIEDRLRKVIEVAVAAGASIPPDCCLELARKARAGRRWEDMEKSAKQGLDLARKNKLAPDAATVLNLHAEAAWALFAQNKTADAEEHLKAMRNKPGVARMANVIDGLAAVREGRLEAGVLNLAASQQDPRFARSLLPVLGLARAFQGLGDPSRALLQFNKLDAAYKALDQLSEEERMLAAEFFPSADAVSLEELRCHLALNQVEPALAYKKRLESRPLGLAARLLVINHYLAAGRGEMAKGNTLDARDLFDAADKELKAVPQEARGEPAVVWANVLLTASRSGAGNVDKAEQMLKDHVASHPSFESHLLLVRWLEGRKRLDAANAVLADMDTRFADRKPAIAAMRARLGLLAGQGDLGRLVALFPGPADDASGDVLQVLYLTGADGNGKPRTLLDALLGWHDSRMLLNLWNGEKAQAAGKLEDAIHAYGQALLPSRYQREAQTGLLTSLVALADKDSPKRALDLIQDLRHDTPQDPALLAAYAEMSLRLDAIQGPASMEAALSDLERVLAPLNRRAVAADLKARGYYVAGRPDLTRAEAARALQLDPAYAPVLALAARVAAETENYEACQTYAEELERALYGTPDAKREAPVVAAPRGVLDRPLPTAIDGQYWRAVAAEHLGRKQEAQRLYETLIDKHPTVAAGYLGLAKLRERAKDMPGALASALASVRQWRAKNPKDSAGAAAEVRLLVLSNKIDEAQKAGDAYAGDNAAALVTVGRAFLAAKAYNQAEAYGRRALQAAKEKADTVAAQLVIGDACRARALAQAHEARKNDVEKALAAYKAAWALTPGNPAAGYPLASLQALECNEGDAAYAVVQSARKGLNGERMVSGDRLSVDQLETLADVYRIAKHTGDSVMLLQEAVKQHYKREPRVLLRLGLAYRDQKMLGNASAVLLQAEQAALERADAAPADQKSRWEAVAEKARMEREKLDGKPKK